MRADDYCKQAETCDSGLKPLDVLAPASTSVMSAAAMVAAAKVTTAEVARK